MNGQDEFVKQREFRKTEILWTLVTLSIPTVLEEVLATLLQYVEKVAKANGANVAVKKFIRFETGEGLEKKVDDFAAEVAAQAAM